LVGEVQIPLSRGEVLMGRSRSCQVLLDDMLVSRHHARFLVSRGALFIEDLGSSNGVRVNETPIAGPTPLNDGDRIIVGTQEIFVRSEPEESVPAESGDGPRANRPTLPVAKPVAVGSQPPSGSEPAPAKKSVHPGAEVQDTTVHTEKQDGLLTMARMADRMMTMGRTDAAARLLGDHLRSVLIGAHVGKQLPPVVADTVGTHGMKLTEATRQGEWANIAVELQLMCRRVLPEKSVAVLEQVLHRVPSIDRHLLGRYQAFLKEIAADLDPEQRTIVDRICALPSR
jgi:pSer/pThr/pTyr-binding forkhead associated (FHA) protein